MRIGDINAMGGGNQGGNEPGQGTIDTEHITTIDDTEYDTAKTRVFYTDGTYDDFAWEGEITEDLVYGAELFDVDPETYEYTWTKDIREVHFGTAVTQIDSYAFSRNTTLSSITFERFANVSISGGAFSECPNLTDAAGLCVIKGSLVCVDPAKLGSNVTIPTVPYQIQRIASYSMVNKIYGRLVHVTIPGNVEILYGAFAECNYITDLYLPDMEIDDVRYTDPACNSWDLGVSYNPETEESQYREITIHCSDGTIVQDTSGNWTNYPNEQS